MSWCSGIPGDVGISESPGSVSRLDLFPGPEPVQIVGPGLHHHAALGQERRPVVGPAVGVHLRVWPVAALVRVADPARRTRIDPAVAVEALGLTGMESRVAVLLAEGMTVRDVAAAMGRGESTIRSHVKHMFAKHGLSRQADLVRLVLAVGGAPESQR